MKAKAAQSGHQVFLRIKSRLHSRLVQAAEKNDLPLATEVIARLERSFDSESIEGLIAGIARRYKIEAAE
jgi:hypothetical protein